MFDTLLEILRADGSVIVNKKLAKTIGLNEAIMYSELVSKYLYFKKKDTLKDGFFYSTIEDFEESTTLSGYQQSKAITKLVKLGLIGYTLKGLPATRYFKILDNNVLITILGGVKNKFSRNLKTSIKEIKELGLKKLEGNNTNSNNTKENNTNKYILTSNKVFDYWLGVMNHNKKKMTIVSINKRLKIITDRLKEGYSEDNCKAAIDGCYKSDYHMGRDLKANPSGTIYDSIELIFRNGLKLENFINRNKKNNHTIKDKVIRDTFNYAEIVGGSNG